MGERLLGGNWNAHILQSINRYYLRFAPLLLLGVLALVAVGGYVLWQEHQYGVSEEYYDGLRNTGLLKGGWML